MKNKLIKKGYCYSLSLFTSVSQSALRAGRAGRREGVRRREDMASRVNWDRTCNTSRGWLAHETCKTNPGWLLGSMKKKIPLNEIPQNLKIMLKNYLQMIRYFCLQNSRDPYPHLDLIFLGAIFQLVRNIKHI